MECNRFAKLPIVTKRRLYVTTAFWIRDRETNMADSGEDSMASSWWGGWLQTAKEKSAAALDMVRKDLAEFGCTMQNEAGHAVELTSNTLKDSLKAENTSAAKEKLTKGLNTFLEGISKALVVPPDDEGQIPITASSAELYDRNRARIHAIQVDPGTYLQEPSGPAETYNMWCEGFNLEDSKGDVSELLVSNTQVRALYTKLVPSQVSHADFWRRYFFKLHQMDVERARKEALMKRAESSRADSLSWEDDWSGDEAAEDSGSDWEKLPRPNQQRSVSPAATPASPPSSSAIADSLSVPPQTSHSAQQGQPQHASETPGTFQEVSLQDTVQVQETSTPATLPAAVEDSLCVNQLQELGSLENGSSDLDSQQKSEGFKEDLDLAAGSDTNEEEQQSVSQPASQAAAPAQLCSEEATQLCERETSSPGHLETQKPAVTEASTDRISPVPEVSLPTTSPATTHDQEDVEAVSAPAACAEPEVQPDSGKEKQQLLAMAAQELQVAVETEPEETDLRTREKGDLVVVGSRSDHSSPVSNASGSKGTSDMEDDWEQDLDIELTEEDMKAAEELAKTLGDNIQLEEDDWESWE